MKVKFVKLAACLAWAGAAVSNAAPADALAATTQLGSYANCSSSFVIEPHTFCSISYTYKQTIKFSSTPCSGGGCASPSGVTYVDFHYSSGRKDATESGAGCPQYMLHTYQLGNCAC